MTHGSSAWEVPAHEVALYSERAHRYALVIPVINEGERIRGQLTRIAEAGHAVDVIVADGGSTDGSLDAGFVQGVNVRAVLTKTGPGKLSAQLRMAYAWCLEQGYDGIVTMDGNGKDGVEAIGAMIAKLDEGCDYVQGSRYLPGGAAENTPLERTIANRLVHAPLLSLGGGHVFTDTTNGFRAYSARYLTHPEVQPFRDEFQVYGLLFYLTVRAGQLGLKVGHVPVTRRYPDSGKVPTKIGGLASKLALLGETVFAATGGYTPKDTSEPKPRWLWPVLVVAALLLPLLWSVWAAPPYSPDSWAFYELSKTIFGDFYRFEHFRSYASTSPYSSAFPPLYPSLIAVADAVLGTGARTGLLIAFASFAGFALVSEAIGRRVTGAPWIGLVAALVLLLGPSMVLTEMEAGRTIPLQMLLMGAIVLALTRGAEISFKTALWIGVLSGLAVMNRFDAILLPLLSAGAIVWLTRRPALAAASFALSLIVVSPWVAYSLTTFGSVFATDNAGIAAGISPGVFVTDWWPEAQPDWSDDPGAWLAKVIGNLGALLLVAIQLSLTGMGLAVFAAIALLLALQHFIARRPSARGHGWTGWSDLKPLIAFALISAVMLAPQVLTGYLEYRYYTAIFWAVFMLLLCGLILRSATLHQTRIFARLAALAVGVCVVGFVLSASLGNRPDQGGSASFDKPAELAQLQRCIAESPEARILVIGNDTFAAQAGALAGLHTMMAPRNLMEGRLDADGAQGFAQAFKVDYLLIADSQHSAHAQSRFDLEPVGSCPLALFRVNRG